MLGLEGLGLGWGWGSWNRLDRDKLGIDKIGWELCKALFTNVLIPFLAFSWKEYLLDAE